MVVTFLLATSESCVWHERSALPSMCTVQAPHNPAPQPNFVPVSFRCSRTIQRSGVSASASTLAGLPLIVKATVVMSTSPSFGARMARELFAPLLESAVLQRPHIGRVAVIGRGILEALQAYGAVRRRDVFAHRDAA